MSSTLPRHARLSAGCVFRSQGFTLLEVLVAVAVLSLALVPLLATQSRHLYLLRTGECQMRAAAQAHALGNAIASAGAQHEMEGQGFFSSGIAGYRWQIKREQLASGLGTGLQRVTVQVGDGSEDCTAWSQLLLLHR